MKRVSHHRKAKRYLFILCLSLSACSSDLNEETANSSNTDELANKVLNTALPEPASNIDENDTNLLAEEKPSHLDASDSTLPDLLTNEKEAKTLTISGKPAVSIDKAENKPVVQGGTVEINIRTQ